MPVEKAKRFTEKARNRLKSKEEKSKVAIYWTGSCGGCDSTIIGIGEKLLEIADQVELVLWPIAVDKKYSDLEGLEEDEIDLTLFNGALRQDHHIEMADKLREKSKILVSYGACAHMGGIPGLADLSGTEEVMETKYSDVKTFESGERPRKEIEADSGKLTMPVLTEEVRPLSHQVEVDYIVPGCPPNRDETADFLLDVLSGDLPDKGSIIAGEKNLCWSCPRDRQSETIKTVDRVHERRPDPGKCILDQGILCMGPVTRGGCGARCIKANVPCRGCFGPADSTVDVGSKYASSLGPLIGPEDNDKIAEVVENVKDFHGLTHYFSLPYSPLKQFIDVDAREGGFNE
ncbi:MAG: NADH:ubiquinone oxidoreductase [Candidatus Nanohalobium sp.]